MISENLRYELLDRAEKSSLNFKALIAFMEESNFEFVGGHLRNALGLASPNRVFLDMRCMQMYDDEFVFFSILHEYAHLLSINKMGKDGMVSHFMERDKDKFSEHFIYEEILADRFGRLFFYHFNKRLFPNYRTQQLESKNNARLYKEEIIGMLGIVSGDEDYDRLLGEFLEDWNDVNINQPQWYRDVELLVNGEIRRGFHRLQGDGFEDDIYYGTMDSSEIIYEHEVSYWREIENNGQVK